MKYAVILRYTIEADSVQEAAGAAFTGLADFQGNAKSGNKVKLFLVADDGNGPHRLLEEVLEHSIAATGTIE